MPGTLENLLRSIRDGIAGAEALAEARRLLAHDARIPEELRAVALQDEDDLPGDAAGLLSVLGADDLFSAALAEAIVSEIADAVVEEVVSDEGVGGEAVAPVAEVEAPEREAVEEPLEEPVWTEADEAAWAPVGDRLQAAVREESGVADAPGEPGRAELLALGRGVLEALGLERWLQEALPVAEAVRHEAGTAGGEVVGAVEAELGLSRIEVAAAIRAEAGEIDLVGAVLEAVAPGAEAVPVAEAVRAEAGVVSELAPSVLAALGHEVLPVAGAVRREAGRVELGAAVLEAVGAEVLPVREAVLAEAGTVEVAAAVLDRIGAPGLPPVAEAVRSEAGRVEVADLVTRTLSPEVLAGLLDHQLDANTHRLVAEQVGQDKRGDELTAMADLGRDLRSALEEEGGEVPQLWAAVAKEIGIADPEQVVGWDGTELAEAVRAEAGTIDVADAVMQGISRYGRPVDMPLAEMPLESLPPAANRGTWALGALLMAAVALLVLGVGRFGGDGATTEGIEPVANLQFASADELVVEDLQYGDDVQVFQMEGDDGAVIIWVDEEAVL